MKICFSSKYDCVRNVLATWVLGCFDDKYSWYIYIFRTPSLPLQWWSVFNWIKSLAETQNRHHFQESEYNTLDSTHCTVSNGNGTYNTLNTDTLGYKHERPVTVSHHLNGIPFEFYDQSTNFARMLQELQRMMIILRRKVGHDPEKCCNWVIWSLVGTPVPVVSTHCISSLTGV